MQASVFDLGTFPATCQVPGRLAVLPVAKLTRFHHTCDLGNPISPPAKNRSLWVITGKGLLCGCTASPASLRTGTMLGSHSKDLLIKAFCSSLSVCMHPRVRLFQYFILFYFIFRATSTAYGSSQARAGIGATTASLYHSHSNAGSLPTERGQGLNPHPRGY